MAIRICVGPCVVDKQGGLQQVLVTYHCLLEGLTLFWFKYAQSSHTSQLDDSVTPGNVETWPAAKSTETYHYPCQVHMLDIMSLGTFLKDSPHNSQSIDLYLHPFTAPCLEQIAPCILKPPNPLKQSCLVNHPWTMSVWRESHHSKRSWPFASPPCTSKWWKALNLWVVFPFFSSPSTVSSVYPEANRSYGSYGKKWDMPIAE